MANARFSILQSTAVADKRISNSQFRTLAALGTFGDKNGWCFPKLRTLSEMLGKSRQAISMDLKALAELGYIEISHRYREDGSQQHSLYRLIFDARPPEDGQSAPGDEDNATTPEPPLSSPEPPLSSELNPPLSSELNPPLSPELNPPLSSEVDALTTHINAPINVLINAPPPADENDKKNNFAKIAKLYSEEIGVLSGMIGDEINACLDEYPFEWFEPAIREAAMSQARNWKYVKAILKNWKSHGLGWKPQRPGTKPERTIGKLMN